MCACCVYAAHGAASRHRLLGEPRSGNGARWVPDGAVARYERLRRANQPFLHSTQWKRGPAADVPRSEDHHHLRIAMARCLLRIGRSMVNLTQSGRASSAPAVLCGSLYGMRSFQSNRPVIVSQSRMMMRRLRSSTFATAANDHRGSQATGCNHREHGGHQERASRRSMLPHTASRCQQQRVVRHRARDHWHVPSPRFASEDRAYRMSPTTEQQTSRSQSTSVRAEELDKRRWVRSGCIERSS